jgi:hypothetical protein
MNEGTLVLTGKQGLRLDPGGTNRLGGTLRWSPEKTLSFRSGESFTLLPNIGNTMLEGTFEQVIPPELPPGFRWDTENLYSAGTITVAP